jgi:predicted PurR-regulated permease PerM
VPRLISFIVLLAIVLLVGAVFFQVMAQFMVPLFLACVLLVVFQPLHRWLLRYLPKYPRVAALATTAAILLVALLPLVWLGWNAYGELRSLFRPSATADDQAASHLNTPQASKTQEPPAVAAPADNTKSDTFVDKPHSSNAPTADHMGAINRIAFQFRDDIKRITTIAIEDRYVLEIVTSGQRFLASKALSGLQSAVSILVGLAITVIALYYFLADGPAMIATVLDLSPLDSKYEQELLERFADISRAVVVATLLSAVVQGTLAGIGYAFALPREAPVFLLTALTMVTALVPFVGAAATWICVAGWVYLYGEHVVNGQVVQGDPTKAIILAIYCTLVVSSIDNVIKPFILHGQSKLHPLLALLSILGGVQVLGPVGILVGPMLVSFLQALLNMLRKELDSFGGTTIDSSSPLAVPANTTAQVPTPGIPPVAAESKAVPAASSTGKSGAEAASSSKPSDSPNGGGRRAKRKK